jgi:hypothetical protein
MDGIVLGPTHGLPVSEDVLVCNEATLDPALVEELCRVTTPSWPDGPPLSTTFKQPRDSR